MAKVLVEMDVKTIATSEDAVMTLHEDGSYTIDLYGWQTIAFAKQEGNKWHVVVPPLEAIVEDAEADAVLDLWFLG